VALRFSYAEGFAEKSCPSLNDLTARRYGFDLSVPSLPGLGRCGAGAPLEDGLASLAGGFSAIERVSDGILIYSQINNGWKVYARKLAIRLRSRKVEFENMEDARVWHWGDPVLII
jgi:hypothetical protein